MLHLTSPRIAASRTYQRWAASLPGRQLLGEPEAGPGRPGTGLGFQASARTLTKLHAVSPHLFPLPACCTIRSTCLNGTPATQSRSLASGTSAAADGAAVPQERACLGRDQRDGRESATAYAARLLTSLDGGVGRPIMVSDAACPAALDAGEPCCPVILPRSSNIRLVMSDPMGWQVGMGCGN